MLVAAGALGGFAPAATASASSARSVGAVVAAASLGSTSSPDSGLHVIPFPGTPDAAPTTAIIFSSLSPTDIATVVVTGSASGAHSGHLAALPDASGTAFVPDSAFTAGETVDVTATLTSPQAGTASGAPGATTLHFSFTVAVPGVAPAGHNAPPAGGTAAAGPSGPAVFQHFHSVPDFEPPIIRATSDPDTSSGDIFLTARHARSVHTHFQGGPMILDGRGRLVWFRYVNGQTTNLEKARLIDDRQLADLHRLGGRVGARVELGDERQVNPVGQKPPGAGARHVSGAASVGGVAVVAVVTIEARGHALPPVNDIG